MITLMITAEGLGLGRESHAHGESGVEQGWRRCRPRRPLAGVVRVKGRRSRSDAISREAPSVAPLTRTAPAKTLAGENDAARVGETRALSSRRSLSIWSSRVRCRTLRSARPGNSRGLWRRSIVVAGPGRVKGASLGALRARTEASLRDRGAALDPPRPGHQLLARRPRPPEQVSGERPPTPRSAAVLASLVGPRLLAAQMKPGVSVRPLASCGLDEAGSFRPTPGFLWLG